MRVLFICLLVVGLLAVSAEGAKKKTKDRKDRNDDVNRVNSQETEIAKIGELSSKRKEERKKEREGKEEKPLKKAEDESSSEEDDKDKEEEGKKNETISLNRSRRSHVRVHERENEDPMNYREERQRVHPVGHLGSRRGSKVPPFISDFDDGFRQNQVPVDERRLRVAQLRDMSSIEEALAGEIRKVHNRGERRVRRDKSDESKSEEQTLTKATELNDGKRQPVDNQPSQSTMEEKKSRGRRHLVRNARAIDDSDAEDDNRDLFHEAVADEEARLGRELTQHEEYLIAKLFKMHRMHRPVRNTRVRVYDR